ncbi:MAG: MFS transporter [Ignavibacteria bacterium]|nr:MFS transporter [Ignavibacteria bacterium]
MNRNLLLVTLSMGAWGVGEGFFIYFQPLYLQQWGADPLLIGGIYGAMGITMALAQIPAGYLSDRFGSRSIMWGSWILGTLAAWTMALANSLPLFVAGMVLYGLTGFVMAPMNSYITNVRGNMTVGRALAVPSGIYSLGAVIGPIIGGLVADKLGFRAVYFIAALIFILSTAIVLFVHKNPEVHHIDKESSNPKGLLKNTRFIAFLGVVLITTFALYLPQPFTPSFLQNQQSLTSTTIGIMGAFGSLGSALAMLFLSHLGSLTGFFISQIMIMVFAILFLKGDNNILFGLGYVFIGGYRLCRVMILSIGRSLIHPAETGLAYGLMETMNAVTLILAPILAGALYRYDPYSMYRIGLILLGIVLLINVVIFSVINIRKARTT